MEKYIQQPRPNLHLNPNKHQKRQLLRNDRVNEYHQYFAEIVELHHFTQTISTQNNCNNKNQGSNQIHYDHNTNTKIKEKIQKEGVKKITFGKFEPFNMRILKSSINFQIVEAQLKWGLYSLDVKILNSREISLFHSRKCSKGCNGTVYFIQDQSKGFAVKCNFIKSDQENNKLDLKIRALQEYFISKVASALNCGPKVLNYAGFDLFFNEDCIQFALQQCYEPQNVSLKTINQLKQSLKVLHLSNIVHFDIKNQNIMWSKILKKLVFIDFGLSQIIDGGPQFKYLCTFKGTLNYCSKQMAVIFESNRQEYIDIYYNDIVCLSSTINKYRRYLAQSLEDNTDFQNFMLNSQPKYDQYVEQYVKNIVYRANDNNFLVELKIIMLKYYIYTKEIKEINKIHNQSDELNSLIFSNKILSFVKEVLSAYEMKQFYRKYISKAIKDTVDYGWVQKWSKGIFSKLNYQQKISPQTRIMYQSYYLNIIGQSHLRKQLMDSLSKQKIMSMLMQSQIKNKQVYFYLFISFISFIQNRFEVEDNEKSDMVEHFNQIFLPSLLKQEIQPSQGKQMAWMILQKLSIIFQYILSFYSTTCLENHTNQIDSDKRIQLICQIIEHIFFFALFPTAKIIQILSNIYNLSLWCQNEKLQIIVRIIVINDWNIAPLFGRKSISLKAVQLWTLAHLQQFYLIQPKPSYINIVLRYLKCPKQQSKDYILDQQIFNNFSPNFKFYLQAVKISQSLVNCSAQTLIAINMQIQQIIPPSLQGRPFSIHFMIFSVFQSRLNNTPGCKSILNIFERNIRCFPLSSCLILHNIINIVQNPMIQVLLKQVTILLKNIRIQNIAYFFVLINDSILMMMNFWYKNPNSFNRYQSQHNIFLGQLQNLVNRLDYRNKTEDRIQKCFLREGCHYYFDMKLTYNKFTNKIMNFTEEISLLQKYRQQQNCQSCFAGMTHQLQRFLREHWLYQNSQLPQLELIRFYRQTQEFTKNFQKLMVNHDNCADQSLKLLSHSTSFAIIKSIIQKGNITTQLLKIIYQFALMFKQDHQFQAYFINYDSCPRLIELTLASIQYINGLFPMILFIKKLLKICRLMEQQQLLQNLINSFSNLMANHFTQGFQQKMEAILQQLRKQQSDSPQVVTFYYSYLLTTKESERKYRYIIKIFKLLENFPHKIAIIFKAKIYYLLLYAQNNLFIDLIRISCKDNIKYLKSLKKTNRLKKQLIKMAGSLQIFIKISKKQKQGVNYAITFLHKKCYSMGIYNIEGQCKSQLSLTPKIR